MFIKIGLVFAFTFVANAGAVEISPLPRYILRVDDVRPNVRRITLSFNGESRPLGRGNGEFLYTDLKKYVDTAVDNAKFKPFLRRATTFSQITALPCVAALFYTAGFNPHDFFAMTKGTFVDAAIIPVIMAIFLHGQESIQVRSATNNARALNLALENKVSLSEDDFIQFIGHLEAALLKVPTWSSVDGRRLL